MHNFETKTGRAAKTPTNILGLNNKNKKKKQ